MQNMKPFATLLLVLFILFIFKPSIVSIIEKKATVSFTKEAIEEDDTNEEKKIAYTLLSENKNIIYAGKAVIVEENLPKMIFELAESKKKSGISNFNEYINENIEEVNKIIEKYM